MAAYRDGLYVRTDSIRRYGPFSSVAAADAYVYHMNSTLVTDQQAVLDSQTRFPVRLADSAPGEARYAHTGMLMYDAGVDTDGVMLVGQVKPSYPESRVNGLKIVGYWGGLRGPEYEIINPHAGVISPITGTIKRDGWLVTSGLVQQRVHDVYYQVDGAWVQNLGHPGRQLRWDDETGYTGFGIGDADVAGVWYSRSPWTPTSGVHVLVYMFDVQTYDYAA